MKSAILLLMSLLTASVAFSEAPSTVTIDGRTYRQIVGVSLNPDGTVGVVSGSAVLKFPLNDVPNDFITAWGISAEQIQVTKETAQTVITANQEKARLTQQANNAAQAKRPLIITPETRGGITLSHTSAIYLSEELKKKLTNLNTPTDRISVALSSIPVGGRVRAYIERPTIGSANTKYFTFIVFDANGKEVLRHVGSDDIANVPSRSSRMWWNIELFDLVEPMQRPLKIRVVDTLMNEAYEFEAK